MKRIALFLLSLGVCIAFAGCQPAQTVLPPTPVPATDTLAPPPPTAPPPTATVEPTAAPTLAPTKQAEPVLELVGPGSTKQLTLDEIMALPAVVGQAGIKTSTGRIVLPTAFKGVPLLALMEEVGGLEDGMGVNVVAEDGYAISYSYDQITNGNFIAYSPASGDEIAPQGPLQVVIAYEIDGQPLPKDSDGTLRLVIISSQPNQVTDGHWSVKWVNKIETMSMVQDWKLNLKGNIEGTIDRASFESCSAPQCHQTTWTDDKAQEWVGVPLYLLLGYVDDEIKHEGPAFNDALAKADYLFKIVAADGYSVSMNSARVARNRDLVVAYLVNGNPLPDKNFPLRLVGTGLEKSEQIGGISEIELELAGVSYTPLPSAAPVETETPTPAPVAMEDADLLVTGLVDNELALTTADLKALEVVQVTAEHPKSGSQTYEGLRLSSLLDQAAVQAGASKLVFTAGDGYRAEVALADVRACADCLVAFTGTEGELFLVMPDMPSSTWLKDVVKIEAQ